MTKKPKPYNSNTQTEAAFRSMIVSGLRKASMYWKPKRKAVINARHGFLVNPLTHRENNAGKCESCNNRFLEKELKADHINPVVPVEGFEGDTFLGINWTEYIRRMFVEVHGYQVLCKECHDKKTKEERLLRKN